MAKLPACMYCGGEANSTEHIVATRFLEVLREDPRGLNLPLTITLDFPMIGRQRRIGGKRTKRGHYTMEYTTEVCEQCNNEWMNDMDTAAFDDVAEMIRGNSVELDTARQAAVAAWVCKVALTARSEPNTQMPIDPQWTDWMFNHHSAIPGWFVWIARYIGSTPSWFQPMDVSTVPPPWEPAAGPNIVIPYGVVATLAIGYFATQVFGVSNFAFSDRPKREFPRIYPPWLDVVPWPPPKSLNDETLLMWSERLVKNKVISLPAKRGTTNDIL